MLNSLLVDRTWNSVISQSHKIMAMLPLTIRSSRRTENKNIKKFKRCYQTIEYYNGDKTFIPKYLLESLKNVAREVKTLNINGFLNLNTVFSVFSVCLNVPKLEKFNLVDRIVSIQIDYPKFIEQQQASFAAEQEPNFLEVFSMVVSKLKINVPAGIEYGDFPELLALQPFEELELRNYMIPPVQTLQQTKRNESLESLVLHAIKFVDDEQGAEFFSLFPTISKLHLSSIEFSPVISQTTIKKVIQSLKNLKEISISSSTGFAHDLLYNIVSTSLTSLKLKLGSGDHSINWKQIIDNNPKLKMFYLEGSGISLANLIASARDQMVLKVKGDFQLTEDILQSLKSSSKDFHLKVPKSSLMSPMKLDEILGERRERVEFI